MSLDRLLVSKLLTFCILHQLNPRLLFVLANRVVLRLLLKVMAKLNALTAYQFLVIVSCQELSLIVMYMRAYLVHANNWFLWTLNNDSF